MESAVAFCQAGPKGAHVCPFMDDLVECLYTDELIALIETTCREDLDKRTFLMFVMMYFFTYLNTCALPPGGTEGPRADRKQLLKEFMSDLIMNSEKRKRCVDMYVSFEQSVARGLGPSTAPSLL